MWDAEGKRYLDLTAAFGVAAAGHANPAVVRAGQEQMGKLLHAMGDVHPHAPKALLARELSGLTFERWEQQPGKVIYGSSGFEAVEAALKTARLATGKRGVIVFEGGYHGLGYGALNATHRELFRGRLRINCASLDGLSPTPPKPRIWPGWNLRCADRRGGNGLARCWWNRCRRAGESGFRRWSFCNFCASGAMRRGRC